MNKLLKTLFDLIKLNFPDQAISFENRSIEYIEITNSNQAAMGGVFIQTSEENSIWIRISPNHSGYIVENTVELISILRSVFRDEILWIIGYENEDWFETSLMNAQDKIEIEKNINYYIYSWSGKLDHTLMSR